MLIEDLKKSASKSIFSKITKGDISNSRLKFTDMYNQLRENSSYKEGSLGRPFSSSSTIIEGTNLDVTMVDTNNILNQFEISDHTRQA